MTTKKKKKEFSISMVKYEILLHLQAITKLLDKLEDKKKFNNVFNNIPDGNITKAGKV